MKNLFNLANEKWIPCQQMDGSVEEFGLFEVLSKAHTISTLVSDLSIEKVSMYRLLLAFLHRVFGPNSQSDWQELWQKGRFDEKQLGSYFQKWHNRFNLYDDTYPFYQTKDITAEVRPFNGYSFQLALYHIASGNNATLFDHHTADDEMILSAAEAARLVITAQSFAFGFRSYKDGPSARGVNFIIVGDNLYRTLMMNMVRYDDQEPFPILTDDLPAWERENSLDPDRKKPDGYLDYLTWQTRKILLHPDEENTSVRLVQVDNGLKLDVSDNPFTKNPMMQYSRVEKPSRGGAPYRPLKFREGRALWRDSTSIMEINSESQEPPAAIGWINDCGIDVNKLVVNSVGISSNQGKVNFYLEELFTFPSIYLKKEILVGQLKTCLEHAEAVRKKLWGSINQMAEIILSPEANLEEGRKPDRKDKQQIIDHIFAEDQYWVGLEIPFYQLLNDLPKKGEEAMAEWDINLRRSVWDAFEYARGFIGSSPVALKAGVLGGRMLGAGLKKLME